MKSKPLSILLLFISSFTYANSDQTLSTQNPFTTLPANWTASGYIDGSYNYLLRSNQFTSGTFNRVYDLNPDGITLHQAALTIAYQPQEGFGGLINPIFGKDTFIFAPYGWDPFLGIKEAGFAIPQGYLQYTKKSFNLIGGIFNTLAGAEYLDATKDTNFSRSILWGYAEPTTHLGIRSAYVFNDKLTFIAGINNGWDTIQDNNQRKTFELSLTFSPNAVFSLIAVGYSGAQRAADKTNYGPISTRNLLNLVATFKATKKLSLVASYDYGVQPKAALPTGNIGEAIWQGFAEYINYQFNDKWRTSFRSEIFNDRDGYRTGVVQQWKEATLTLGYAVWGNFELRVETRHDFSNVNSFLKANCKGTSSYQQSYAIEGVAKFL